MYEIRFHGRGGQGAVLASKILAKALVEEGKFVKAIPSFGFERRGAPVEAYLRFDNKTIRQNTNIYHPHCVICLDPTLPRSVNIFRDMQEGGVWVQATKKGFDQLTMPETLRCLWDRLAYFRKAHYQLHHARCVCKDDRDGVARFPK
jgi:phenylglyoxylate dehydrogenase gamma subunit